MTPAESEIKRWRDDPLYFVVNELHAEPDQWQAEGLRAFANPETRHISLQACVGPGKSALLSWCGWNFLACYGDRGHHPNGAAVSISADNLKDNLWKEFAVWRDRSEFLRSTFEWTKERIFARQFPATWFISARSWSKTANAEEQGRTLSGLHSKFILYLIDESGDINPAILRAAEQGLSNCEWGKIMQAGNPTSQNGILHLAASVQRHIWHIIRVTGDPDDPRRSSRIDPTWARQQIALYGRDNPWIMFSILGLFPPSAINVLLGPDEVEAAMQRTYKEDIYNWAQKRLGIDVARFGDDRSVIFPRQGLASFMPVVMRHQRTTDIAARVAQAKITWGSEMEFVDDSGHWGHGVIDNLYAAGYAPQAVLFEGQAIDPRYRNKRTEMWLEMADWVKRGGALPNLPELVRELTSPTYTFVQGKFMLEPKDMIKKRIGVSPDLADALGLTFALKDQPTAAGIPEAWRPAAHALSDSDPFADGKV